MPQARAQRSTAKQLGNTKMARPKLHFTHAEFQQRIKKQVLLQSFYLAEEGSFVDTLMLRAQQTV
jgi:hypothetical protein